MDLQIISFEFGLLLTIISSIPTTTVLNFIKSSPLKKFTILLIKQLDSE